MPSINNRALLLDLTAFIAENNIRRGVLTVATNTLSTGEGILERSMILDPTATTTLQGLTGNQATVIKTNVPLNVTLWLAQGEGENVQFVINTLFVWTDAIDHIDMTNSSLTDQASVRILHL
jgi:hypothetical protein